jgi:hypothetical protein
MGSILGLSPSGQRFPTEQWWKGERAEGPG